MSHNAAGLLLDPLTFAALVALGLSLCPVPQIPSPRAEGGGPEAMIPADFPMPALLALTALTVWALWLLWASLLMIRGPEDD